MHTTFCDGKNSAEEMVLSAIEKGLNAVGVLIHSHTAFDHLYCVKKDNIKVFQEEMARLKEKYKDKIKVLCGVEQDYYGTESTNGFDYVIGSLHYFNVNGKMMHIDHSPEYFDNAIKELFGGDYYLAAEHYYSVLSDVVEKTGADIIGHFDLVTKFNRGNRLFDENHPRYVNASMEALKKLIATKKVFEINTGAISRGYADRPYPTLQMIEIIKESGGKLILSSDSHTAENVGYMFDKYKHLQNY